MHDAARRGGLLTGLALVLLSGPAMAAAAPATAAADLTTRDGPAESSAVEGFRLGAEEDNPAPSAHTDPPARAEADAALGRGEDEYLKARLRGAEKQFSLAADAYLSSPAALDAARASRALTLLAQVHLALGRGAAAEKAIERALRFVPGFPGAVVPPPEVAAIVSRLRSRPDLQTKGRLSVTSERAGVRVTLGGLVLGTAPLDRDDLPQHRLALTLTDPDGGMMSTEVDLAAGPATIAWRPVGQLRAAVGDALRRGDENAFFAAASDLEASTGAAQTCVGVLESDGTALVARVVGRRRAFDGGDVQPVAPDESGFRALGRRCRTASSEGLGSVDVGRRLFPHRDHPVGVEAPVGSSTATVAPRWVTLGLTGLAVIAAGTGGYFAWQATDAQNRYDGARSSGAADRAADDARSAAWKADVGFGGAVVLGGTALFLTVWD